MKKDVKNGRLTFEDLVEIEATRQKFSARWVALVGVHDGLKRFPCCGDEFQKPFEVPPQKAIGNVAQLIRSYEDRITGKAVALHHPREQGALMTCISAHADRLKQVHAKLVHESGMLGQYLFDPICGLQVLADAPWSEEGMCGACVKARREIWQAERERLWAEMDDWLAKRASAGVNAENND
ncbi:hypothetical protein C0992_007064 [Termitomyces sp. T32_za158]|nr:hypothetical protein C0992_007064 [Termitomyces sp. T32_za158]